MEQKTRNTIGALSLGGVVAIGGGAYAVWGQYSEDENRQKEFIEKEASFRQEIVDNLREVTDLMEDVDLIHKTLLIVESDIRALQDFQGDISVRISASEDSIRKNTNDQGHQLLRFAKREVQHGVRDEKIEDLKYEASELRKRIRVLEEEQLRMLVKQQIEENS